MATSPINPNRHSAPVTYGPHSPGLLDGDVAGVHARTSVGGVSGAARSTLSGAGAIGRPASLTLPAAPNPDSTAPTNGVETMAEGMEKTTRAGVDVARRGFWKKCLTAAVTVTAVVAMSVATGGLGTIGLVGLGLMGGMAVKGSADAVLSLMNWRNKKADLLGQKPPFAFLEKLPEAVRQDATAAGLVGLGMPIKGARFVSGALDVAMGVGSIALFGYSTHGMLGVGAAMLPVGLEMGLHALTHKLEARRERHVEDIHSKMNSVADRTRAELDSMQELMDRLAPTEDEQALEGLLAPDDSGAARLRELQKEVRALKSEAIEQMEWLKDDLMDRVEKKALAKTSGVAAVALDGVEQSVHLTDVLLHTPLHALSTATMAVRSGIEFARTVRSERRDNDKMQTFQQLHEDLQKRIEGLSQELQAQIDDLRSLHDELPSERAHSEVNRQTAYFGSDAPPPNYA